jgi:hypothetical protein
MKKVLKQKQKNPKNNQRKMKNKITSTLVALLCAVALGSVASSMFGINPDVAIGLSLFVSLTASLLFRGFAEGVAYNLVYSPALFTGTHFEEIFHEMLFMNSTINNGLVRLIDNVNTEIVLTETNVVTVPQPYKASPTSADAVGSSLTFADKLMRPVQLMLYDEFTPNSVILSRLGKPNSGSTTFPKVTDEYVNLILERYGLSTSQTMESRFWNGATTATKAAAALLTPGTGQNAIGTAEQTYIAAAPASEFDGILTKLIMSFSVAKRRIKVAGAPITSSNIADEYAKVYAAILPQLLFSTLEDQVRIFAPRSHKQLINIFNTNATYRDLFAVTNGVYSYNNVIIDFVPLPENTIIAGLRGDLVWGCDVTAASAMVKIDFLSANSEDMFIKMPYTQESAFVQAQQFVVYVG